MAVVPSMLVSKNKIPLLSVVPEKIVVPTAVLNNETSTPESPLSTDGELININTATLEEFDSLPGIGPTIAQRIIDYRTENGPFSTIEELMDVSGVGPATFDEIKNLITV